MFNRGLQEAVRNPSQNPLSVPLHVIVREKLAGETDFWTHLFAAKLPHPLDSHPTLQVRLDALQQKIGIAEAQAIVLEETASAWDCWFAGREELFTPLTAQAAAAIERRHTHLELKAADYQSPAGRILLD